MECSTVVLNDVNRTSWRLGENVGDDVLVSRITLNYGITAGVDSTFEVTFSDDRPSINIPYHSVLFWR